MRSVVVTGTDTGVGKTIVTAALARAYVEAGQRVAVVKPTQTGVRANEPGDVDTVARLGDVRDVREHVRLRDPLAPDAAARREGVRLPHVSEHVARIRALGEIDVVLVEGAGGVLVRLDSAGSTVADLAVLLQAGSSLAGSSLGGEAESTTVVVTRAVLGTLNHTALTVEALRNRGVQLSGLVIGSWPAEPDLAAQCNLEELTFYTAAPVIGRIPESAGRLPVETFAAAAPGWFVSLP